MARPCTVCSHERRSEIDAALVAGESFRHVSERFGISTTAAFRHRQEHLPAAIKAAAEATHTEREVQQALDVVAQLRAINGAVLTVLKEARDEGNPELVLKASDRVLRQLELQARLLGQLHEQQTVVNVLISPTWISVRAALLTALAPYPEARAAAAAALLTAEASS